MEFIAWFLIIIYGLSVIVQVGVIDRPRPVRLYYSTSDALVAILVTSMVVAVCGRVLGWW